MPTHYPCVFHQDHVTLTGHQCRAHNVPPCNIEATTPSHSRPRKSIVSQNWVMGDLQVGRVPILEPWSDQPNLHQPSFLQVIQHVKLHDDRSRKHHSSNNQNLGHTGHLLIIVRTLFELGCVRGLGSEWWVVKGFHAWNHDQVDPFLLAHPL